MSHVETIDMRDQRSDRGDGSVILYAYGDDDETAIKIGRTTQAPSARRIQHEGVGPLRRQLHFLMGVVAMNSDETYVHNYFRAHRYDGTSREWFHASDELIEWLRWMKRQYFVAKTEDECAAIERVSSDLWLPGMGTEDEDGRAVRTPMRLALGGKWAGLDDPEVTGDDFYTHSSIIEAARSTLGIIDLDPATHPTANRVVRAKRTHTIADNGLEWPWRGRVWCNPPFGKWEHWGPKIVGEWRRGEVTAMCVLLATRALTAKCNAEMLATSDAICVLRGRIPFWGPKATSTPDDGHAVLYFGADVDAFVQNFTPIGTVFQGGQAA